jgi:hypothetical protein
MALGLSEVTEQTRQRIIRLHKRYRWSRRMIAQEVDLSLVEVVEVLRGMAREPKKTRGRCPKCGGFGELPCIQCAIEKTVQQRRLKL